jgi:ParB family chromosome partitioning protein
VTTTTKTKTKAKKTVQQLKLVPDTIEQGVLRSVTLDQLPKQLAGDPPSQPFINTIRDFGVIQPIILIEGSQGFTVCGGRNRIKASRLLGLTEIPAIVYPAGWVSPASLALIENAHRRQNALSDLLAITDLAASGYDDEAISTQLGISKSTIKARLRLRNLAPELAQALNEGKMFVTVAEEICVMSPAQQQDLVATYKKNGKITPADVKAVQAAQAAAAKASLPEEVFADPSSHPAAAAPPPPVTRLDEEIAADLVARGWKIKAPAKGGALIEATHKIIGFTAAADYPTLEVNVERTERQWEAYSGFKDWQADQERRKLLSWEDLAAELVQELSNLVPQDAAGITAAIEGLATLLAVPPAAPALPRVSPPPVVV